ncbi:hypothetical protein F443_06349 [Phytophthora nicotianae P1569]|uniref:Uncharacterized protein n=1 Tax=Phytophthora nicotianae P1569 TaxID=1317065 RepID=V9FEU2_PHYNI|nr:hypothetical protein F443_06349 [Phytophthora nicotianae P1569]
METVLVCCNGLRLGVFVSGALCLRSTRSSSPWNNTVIQFQLNAGDPVLEPFEFHVDGVKVQHLGLHSSGGDITVNKEAKCSHEFAFATDECKSPNDRRSWSKALRTSCAITTGDRRASRIKRQLHQSSQRDMMKCSELRSSSSLLFGRRSSQE